MDRKIVIASDSYKGCLSSAEVASAAEEAVLSVWPDATVVKLPVADGGEGTADALAGCLGGLICEAMVSDPLGRPVSARYCVAGRLAVIEVAAACGLTLLKEEERNPLVASTLGVGQLMMAAAAQGCSEFLVGLGGSATDDGGRGMVECPGFLEAMAGKRIRVACDVDATFVGPHGASRLFSRQKGASEDEVEVLEARLEEWAGEILRRTGVDVRSIPGAGAAGGIGGALKAFLGASLEKGIDMVLDAIGFDGTAAGADLVITGEGRTDFQTAGGKTPLGVLRRAQRLGVPTLLLSGAIEDWDSPADPGLQALGFVATLAVTPDGTSPEEAMRPEKASRNIRKALSDWIANH